MVAGEKQGKAMLEDGAPTTQGAPDGRTLKEASRSSGLSGAVEKCREYRFRVVIDGQEFVGGDTGDLEDSELNGVSSLLKMKGMLREDHVNGVGEISKPFDSLLGVVEKEKEMEIKNGLSSDIYSRDGVPIVVDVSGETEKINGKEEMDFGEKMDNGDAIDGMEEEDDDDGNRECEFSVGDFVWGKIRNHPWWPGQIYDPSDASEHAAEVRQSGRLLVAYFGDGSFAWCHPSQLKPFEANFVEMSKVSNSKNFLNAVQKAVDDIGRLVEMKMTCSCVPKQNSSEFDRPPAANAGIKKGVLVPDGGIGKLLIGPFEPNKILGKLKYIAQVISIGCSSLDSMMLKGWLSAFYLAQGFNQLPMYKEPQAISGLEDNAGTLVVDISDYNNAMNVSIQGPVQADWLSSQAGPKFGQIGESLLNCPDVSDDRVCRGKQKSIAEILEADVNAHAKNGGMVKEGTNLGKSATLSRRKRKGGDEVNADGGSNSTSVPRNKKGNKLLSSFDVEKSKVGSLETDGFDAKEETDGAHSLRGRKKKSKGSSMNNDDGGGEENGGLSVGRGDPETEELVEKGPLSRERKKSKYLSPPYTSPDMRGRNIDLESLKVSQEVQLGERMAGASDNLGSPPMVNGSSEAIQKVLSEEPDQQHDKSDDATQTLKQIQDRLIDVEKVNAPTSEVLTEVRSAALSPQYPKESNSFEVAWGFLLLFRSSVYHNGSNNKMYKQSQSHRKRKPADFEPPFSVKGQNQIAHRSSEQAEVKAHEPKSKRVMRAAYEGRKEEAMPKKPKIVERGPDTKTNDEVTSEKGSPNALFVTFGPGSSLPSKDDLIKIYSKYGALNTELTGMFYANFCARVVFAKSSDAEAAFNSSRSFSPFRFATASFELRHLSSASRPSERRQGTKAKRPGTKESAKTTEKAPTSQASLDEGSQLNYIIDKLKMLISMLETSNEKMSPGIKSRLQGEIKDLLEKVSTMAESSS
ncbi:hypothetical protein SLEP1_g19471 [Rubroshorea leprosula]|uniref:PWWP domain-containing protein n=1 Tax=Rubroshorea leprosula TaxID=152421 RepID=A0AAV5J8F5_9ROSI|nr:hypothetical protein SLEP1_g19471 [Rubroshorea leprosula]